MNKVELKQNLHLLINKIDNINLLEEYYREMKIVVEDNRSGIWNNLTGAQKQEVLLSYEDSKNEKGLLDHSDVMKKYDKWL